MLPPPNRSVGHIIASRIEWRISAYFRGFLPEHQKSLASSLWRANYHVNLRVIFLFHVILT
jgi:hypothetical protein